MNRLIVALLACLTAFGCATTSQDQEIFAQAREYAQASPQCKATLDMYPDILAHPQMLPSPSPELYIAFEKDTPVDGGGHLNTRILVEMIGFELKRVSVEETTY